MRGFIPIFGPAREAWEQYQKGNIGQTALCAILAGVDGVGVGCLAKAGLKLVWVGGKQVLKEVAVREVVHQGERQALKVGAEVAGKAVTETKLLSQFNSVESLIQNAGKLRRLKKGVREGWITGNADDIFKTLTQGGLVRPDGKVLLKDGTIFSNHISKTTGRFTLDINKAGKIYKIRIDP